MSRETIDAKARRYLVEGRVVITHVDNDTVRATVRGAGTVHECGFNRRRWWCSCRRTPTQRCSHVAALELVTAPPQVTP